MRIEQIKQSCISDCKARFSMVKLPALVFTAFVFVLCILPFSKVALAEASLQTPSATINLGDLSASSVAPSSYATGPHIEVYLLSNQTAIVPGETIELAVLFKPEPQWHTYWRNPGDSGEAPTISWSTNLNSETTLEFGEINWPLPSPIPVAHLVNYGYEGANLLIVPVSVADNITTAPNSDGEVVITADISWLVCKEDCIPGWATLSIQLPIADSATASASAELFEQTKSLWSSSEIKNGAFEILDDAIAFEIENVEAKDWRVFPFRSDLIQHAAQQAVVHSVDSEVKTSRVIAPRGAYFDGSATQLEWLISDGSQGYYVSASLNEGLASNSAAAPSSDATLTVTDIIIFMLMAFAGGLILNLMPCVLPILSIKALALHASEQATASKFAYLAGIIVCFNLFALVIIALQQGGTQVGWGFHMQEPVIVVALAFLFTLIGLVLLDALSVSSKLSNMGQSLVAGDSTSAHFATGALAVIVASPCTAPFMAAALGIALVSSPSVTLLIFNALALGFALPLTLLFMSRRALALLPKPGPWMETFKHLLAFPMMATVAWLCWVFAGQVGVQAQFVLLLCLIFFCMFIWLLGKSEHMVTKVVNVVGVVICLSIPMWLSASTSGLSRTNPAAIAEADLGVAFDAQTLQSLRDENEVVVVNMTADWCITCKVNEQVALSSDEVKQALEQDGVTYMVGDWTNKNDEILAYLSQYQRAGVPLYVVYAGNQSHQVLPQILTPNMVIQAIKKAKEEL